MIRLVCAIVFIVKAVGVGTTLGTMLIKEDRMQQNSDDHEILVRDKSYVKFERLLVKAESEGRIGGDFKCLMCGMRYMSKRDAEDCCRIIP